MKTAYWSYRKNGTMNRYEIWYAKYRYQDCDNIEIRPVLIWDDRVFVIAFKMTGTDRGDNKEEFRIEYWKEAGLEKPTTIRIGRMLKMQHEDFVRKIGELDPRDRLRFEFRIAG